MSLLVFNSITQHSKRNSMPLRAHVLLFSISIGGKNSSVNKTQGFEASYLLRNNLISIGILFTIKALLSPPLY